MTIRFNKLVMHLRNSFHFSLSFPSDFYHIPIREFANLIQHSPIPFSDLHLNMKFRFLKFSINVCKLLGKHWYWLFQKWHPGLAKAAQRWSNRCLGLVHDNATGLYLDGFGQSGQNIFITTRRTLWWELAISMFHDS